MRNTTHYLPKDLIAMLKKQHYALFGHSAVKLCHWTKMSLRGKGVCYKQKFYGINSHRCLQMTPAVAWCQQKCIFCWRPLITIGPTMFIFDEPREIVEKSIVMQRVLLSGFGSIKKEIGEDKLLEANNPNQVAISLSGEPTIYPLIDELIEEYKKRNFTTFLVTNGMNPHLLERVKPTQLYLSVESTDKKTHMKINNPIIENSWEKLNESIDIFKDLRIRKVIRITAIEGYNIDKAKDFAKIVDRANPEFVEVKAYMHVGYSRERLKEHNMPSFEKIKSLAEEIVKYSENYFLADYSKDSRVVLLVRKDLKGKDLTINNSRLVV
ncbi:MAG: 4-demethylwyosine synthase TYW1 [Candidatus Diapherotrites archaeon]|nr:4-demethylwyosine synthase TYW1 [Candidatus Diapherotrites archaeon]